MTIDFGFTQGAIFRALGKMGAVIAHQSANQDTQNTALSSLSTGVNGQLTSEPDVQAIVGGGYLSALQSIAGGIGPLMQQAAAAYMARIVYRDNPRQGQTLTGFDTLTCLQEVIRQMKLQSATVLAQTITLTPGSFSNGGGSGGDAVLVASNKRPFDGLVLENTYSETMNVYVASDSYVGGAPQGNESLTVAGGASQTDPFAFDWPLGSGCRATISAIDGSQSNSAGNVLTNSGWDNFTGGSPDNWTVAGGAAGVNFQQNTGITYDGVSSLQLIGGAMAAVDLYQNFADAAGTNASLSPLAQLSFNLWMRRGGTAVSGGLTVSLEDDGGNVINDAAGVPNTVTFNLASLTTSWQAFNFVIRTPLILPSVYRIRIRPTANNSAGDSVYLDRMSLGGMNQLYVSGPYLACHSGASPLRIGDVAQVGVVNSRGAGGSLNTWQTLLSRLFYNEVFSNELLFPSSAVPSVQDSWIG